METRTERQSGVENNRWTSWATPTVFGMFMIAFGILAISSTALTGIFVTVWLGIMIAAAGVTEVVFALGNRTTPKRAAFLLGGLLAVAVGLLFILRPAAGLSVLTFLLAGYFLASGLLRAVSSIMDRPSHWGWDLAYGLLSVGFGAYIITAWPVTVLWVIGLLVGIEIMVRGGLLVSLGLSMRRVESTAVTHAHPGRA